MSLSSLVASRVRVNPTRPGCSRCSDLWIRPVVGPECFLSITTKLQSSVSLKILEMIFCHLSFDLSLFALFCRLSLCSVAYLFDLVVQQVQHFSHQLFLDKFISRKALSYRGVSRGVEGLGDSACLLALAPPMLQEPD